MAMTLNAEDMAWIQEQFAALADDTDVAAAVAANATIAAAIADVAAVHVHAATIEADTNELQAEWVDGGRLDLILDIIAADTTTDIPATLAAFATTADVADAVVDEVITSGHTGVGSLAAVINAILEDTATTIPATITTIDDFLDTEIATLTTEMAKVPKSDSTVSWNATALAAIGLAVLNQGLATSDADALNARTVRSALRLLRNKLVIGETTMTIYKEDDSATAWTGTLTTNAAAEPIASIDPN